MLSFDEKISDLANLSRRVAKANGWDAARTAARYPPFNHVIYIIKENRTYDQVFGDMPEGDGDRSLVFFDENNSPNHHALARRFGLFDRFFVNAEVSADGHNWSMAAYISDYGGKTIPSQYSSRRHDYDYAGSNRDRIVSDEDDVNSPSTASSYSAGRCGGADLPEQNAEAPCPRHPDSRGRGSRPGSIPALRVCR